MFLTSKIMEGSHEKSWYCYDVGSYFLNLGFFCAGEKFY